MDGRADGRKDGQKEGMKEGKKHIVFHRCLCSALFTLKMRPPPTYLTFDSGHWSAG
jgi:hypothetical protein